MPVSPVTPVALSRRSVIAAGVAGLALSGCSVDDPVSVDEAPAAPAELGADVGIATEALEQIRGVASAVLATGERFPALAGLLAGVRAMHAAHEGSLVDAVPERARTTAGPSAYAVPASRAAALSQLAAAEQKLHDSLDGLALRAQSGEFARLLASMGAAVAQRLARWPG